MDKSPFVVCEIKSYNSLNVSYMLHLVLGALALFLVFEKETLQFGHY